MVPAIIGGLATLGGGIIGAAEQSSARGQAYDLIQQTIREYEAIGIPSVEAQKLALEEYRQQGMLTPELEESVLRGPSAMEGVRGDDEGIAAQRAALRKLKELGESGGRTLEDESNLRKNLDSAAQFERGQREAILQNARERGVGGSGTELAAQLMAAQGSANRAASAGLDASASAEKRALESIKMGADLGGALDTRMFGQNADRAQAKDAVDAWNAENRAETQRRNIAARNAAQASNLGTAQEIANANVDTRNKQQQFNKGLEQTAFENKLNLTGAKANARGGQAQNVVQGGAANAGIAYGIGSGVGKIASAYADQQYDSDQRAKDREAYGRKTVTTM